MRKNSWIILALLLVFAGVLAACGPAATATQAPTEAVTEAPTEVMTEAPTEVATEAPTEAATQATGGIDCMGAASGDEVTLLYQWSGAEEESLNEALKPLVDACGIVLKPESTRDPAILDTRVQAGTPPDIAFWQATTAVQYKDKVIPVADLGANEDNYADYWHNFANADGVWLALPVKVDIKTIIWYNPAEFDANGYTVPKTWDDLDALVEQMVADGNVPWSMGLESGDATGWTGSDFIQDILLVQQGPDYVNGIIDGSTSYDDAGVKQAYETYGKWAADPKYTVGGAEGTLSTPFLQAIYKVFSDPPEAMMVKQSGFAGGEVKKQFPELEYGTDYDFFGVPGAQGVQGGSDWMMAFSDSNAVKAVFAYLSSEQGGKAWAASGLGISPNTGATVDDYADTANKKFAEILAGAQGFTPDIGDSIPGGFGSAEWKAIVGYLNGGDLDTLLKQAADVQAAALK